MIPKECKRLAELDFPIAVVSKHTARESIEDFISAFGREICQVRSQSHRHQIESRVSLRKHALIHLLSERR